MKIILYHDQNEYINPIKNNVDLSLNDLWLIDFIKVDISYSNELKEELKITKSIALIIEEEAIDFKDIIFEGFIPEETELKNMIISIIWWQESWWCNTDDCWTCWTWC